MYPDMFALASGGQAFDAAGGLASPAMRERLEKLLECYLQMGGKLAQDDERLTGED